MFRQITRTKQQLSQERCTQILKTVPRGVLSLQGDEGYPYGVPTNFWYCPEDGCLYFHSGKQGHKVDSIHRSPKASVCVVTEGMHKDGDWALTFESVIIFGRIEILESDAAIAATRELSFQFTQDATFIDGEIARYGHETLGFRLVPEHITGKQIREA